MKYIYSFLLISFALGSTFANAEELKKIYDKINQKVVEICSTNPDGSMQVSGRCVYNWIDLPIFFADSKVKRSSSDLTEIITPIHTIRNEDSVYAIFQHTLVEINYGLADGRSNIIIYKKSNESMNKFTTNSGWMVSTKDLALEVNEIPGYKKGDNFCLKKSPDGYPNGLAVKITRLFSNDHYAVVDTVSEGVLGMGNTFKSHYTDLNNLVACEDKSPLDPTKIIKTSAPASTQDIKVYDQTSPKDVPLPEASTSKDQAAGGKEK